MSVQDSVSHAFLLGLKSHGIYPDVRGSRVVRAGMGRPSKQNSAR